MNQIDCFQGKAHPKKAQHTAFVGASAALNTHLRIPKIEHATHSKTSVAAGVGGYRPFTDALAQLDAQGQRGHSYALIDHSKRPKHVWNGQLNWIEQSLAAILDPGNSHILLHPVTLAPATIEAVLTAMAYAADSSSGRYMTASLANLAQSAAYSSGRHIGPETVSKVRCYLKKLGYAIEEARGRYLTNPERLLARVHHGGNQIRAASTWCLIIPRPPHTLKAEKSQLKKISRLPSRSSFNLLSLDKNYSPTRAQAHARPASGLKKKLRKKNPTKSYPVAVWKLVSELIEVLPWLDRGQHLGSICQVVIEFVDYSRWSGTDIRDVVNQDTVLRGWNFPTRIDKPVAYLKWRLSQLHQELDGLSPTELREQQRRELVEADNRQAERTGSRFRTEITETGTRRIIELPPVTSASAQTRAQAMEHIRSVLPKKVGRRR